jgi:hypothetical protein
MGPVNPQLPMLKQRISFPILFAIVESVWPQTTTCKGIKVFVKNMMTEGLDPGVVSALLPPQGKIKPVTDPILVEWIHSEAQLDRFSPPITVAEALRQGCFVSDLFPHQPNPEKKPRPCHHLKKVNAASELHAAQATFAYQHKEVLWGALARMETAVASIFDEKSAYRFISLRADATRHFCVATQECRPDGSTCTRGRRDRCCGFGHTFSPFAYACLQEFISLAEFMFSVRAVEDAGLWGTGAPSQIQTYLAYCHYADDTCLICPSEESLAVATVAAMQVAHIIGAELSPAKTQMCVDSLVFLGYGLKTRIAAIFIPEDKMARLRSRLAAMLPGARVTADTLHSLAGLANYVNACFPRWGKQAYQPLYSAAAMATRTATPVVCSKLLCMAARFLERVLTWAGAAPRSLRAPPGRQTRRRYRMETDASPTALGAVLFVDDAHALAFHIPLPLDLQVRAAELKNAGISMPFGETSCLLAATIVWGETYMGGALVDLHADSSAVLTATFRGTTRDTSGPAPFLLMWIFEFFLAHDVGVTTSWLSTLNNTRADSFSRGKIELALQSFPPTMHVTVLEIDQSVIDRIIAQIRMAVAAWSGL